MKDAYVQGEFRRPYTDVNRVSMEQHGDKYIRLNADLGVRPQIRSNEQLKCM